MNRVVLCVALVAGGALFSCKDKPPAPTPPTPVNLFTVKKQDVAAKDADKNAKAVSDSAGKLNLSTPISRLLDATTARHRSRPLAEQRSAP